MISEDDPRLCPLSPGFYEQQPEVVARSLLGRFLVRRQPGAPPLIGRLVETEAYLGEHDRASHAWHGRTPRTAPMYEAAGCAYVYFIYGMYWCLNVVTEEIGRPSAVLLRGAEPIQGIEQATDGPGKLCRAFGLDGSWNRADLATSDLQITVGEPFSDARIATSPRIGVRYAEDWAERPLRFFVGASPFVSGRRWTRGASPITNSGSD